MTDAAATIEVPSTTPPEDVAWQLALADLGGNAAMFGAVIYALWKWMQRMTRRQEDAADRREAQAATDRKEEREVFTTHLEKFTTAIHRVEMAVVRSDEHNQAAVASLRVETHGLQQQVTDIKTHHGGRLDQHHDRLSSIEHTIGAGQSGVRRIGRELTQ